MLFIKITNIKDSIYGLLLYKLIKIVHHRQLQTARSLHQPVRKPVLIQCFLHSICPMPNPLSKSHGGSLGALAIPTNSKLPGMLSTKEISHIQFIKN